MGEVVKLETTCPMSWTVEQALERALEKVRNNTFEADKIYIALCRTAQDGNGPEINYIMAGMQIPEVLGWLDLHHAFLLSEDD